MYIPKQKNGLANARCYLRSRKGCCQKISGEHYISDALLNRLEKQNKTIDVYGLSWLPKKKLKSIGKKRLVANILCSNHNSLMSPLDSCVIDLVEALESINKGLTGKNKASLKRSVNGRELEQWLLKTLIGLIESENMLANRTDPFVYESKLIELICNPNKKWPSAWGLYISVSDEKIYYSSSFEIRPLFDPTTNRIKAILIKFNGFQMALLLGRPDSPSSFGVHRPQKLTFSDGEVFSEINIIWPNGVSKGGFLNYKCIGKYDGVSPDHDVERV